MKGRTARGLVHRAKAAYDNLPLPAPVVLAMVLDRVLARVRPLPLHGPQYLHRAAGAGLVCAGVGLNAWALAERRRRTAGPFALEHPEELVTTGPYALTRHPMYVGWWLIELGTGTMSGSAWVFATLPAQLPVEHRFVIAEEQTLARQFPRSYPGYAEKVPRYLGL